MAVNATVIRTHSDRMWWTSIVELFTAMLGVLIATCFFCILCIAKREGFFTSLKHLATKGVKIQKPGNSQEISNTTESSTDGIPCNPDAGQPGADGGARISPLRGTSVPIYRSEGDPTQRSQLSAADRQPSPEKSAREPEGVEVGQEGGIRE